MGTNLSTDLESSHSGKAASSRTLTGPEGALLAYLSPSWPTSLQVPPSERFRASRQSIQLFWDAGRPEDHSHTGLCDDRICVLDLNPQRPFPLIVLFNTVFLNRALVKYLAHVPGCMLTYEMNKFLGDRPYLYADPLAKTAFKPCLDAVMVSIDEGVVSESKGEFGHCVPAVWSCRREHVVGSSSAAVISFTHLKLACVTKAPNRNFNQSNERAGSEARSDPADP